MRDIDPRKPAGRTKKRAAAIVAALTALLLVASPVSPVYAVAEDPAAEAPVVIVEEPGDDDPAAGAPASEDPAAETGDAEPAPAQEDAGEQPAADEAPAEDAPADEAPAEDAGLDAGATTPADRKITGTVTFPAGMTLAQKRSLAVYVNEPDIRGKEYTYGTAGFSYNPGSGNSATWTVSGLKRGKYHIWVDIKSSNPSYSSSPLYMGPYNPATSYDGPIDLAKGDFTTPTLSMNVGSVMVTVAGLMEAKGRYKLELINQRTGAATDVTRSIFSGWTENNVNYGRHDFNGAPGTYILRGTLTNNGVQVYYDGTLFGTREKSGAKPFTIGLFTRTQLSTFDMREFIDVPRSHQFYTSIQWMAKEGITAGVTQKDGTVKYFPANDVTRGAMVAFLYRIEAPKSYTPKGKSPFVDVKPGDQFYKEIMWAAENKVAAGIKGSDGKLRFSPKASVTRGAMAAFMYRVYKNEVKATGKATNFTDVPKSNQFYGAIQWMSKSGIGAGVKQSNGTVKYLPQGTTTRGAMSAFLYRAETRR